MRNFPDLIITFHVESADHSVGIMSEGFSAWDKDGSSWVEVTNLEADPDRTMYEWFDNESSDKCPPPPNAKIIETALHGFVTGYYRNEEGHG